MPKREQENDFRADRYRDAEAQLGGADSVEKTTYVVGEGTTPEARKGAGPAADVPSRGIPMVAMIVGAIILLVVLVYVAGVFR